MEFGQKGLGFGIQSLGFKVWGLGFGAQGLESFVQGLLCCVDSVAASGAARQRTAPTLRYRCRFQSLGFGDSLGFRTYKWFRVEAFGFRVRGLGFRV